MGISSHPARATQPSKSRTDAAASTPFISAHRPLLYGQRTPAPLPQTDPNNIESRRKSRRKQEAGVAQATIFIDCAAILPRIRSALRYRFSRAALRREIGRAHV